MEVVSRSGRPRTIAATMFTAAVFALQFTGSALAVEAQDDAVSWPPGAQDLGGGWQRIPPAAFGSSSPTGAWTGAELIVVDAERRRAAAYDPEDGAWRELHRPPTGLSGRATSVWTGTEVLVLDRAADGEPKGAAYSVDDDTWRRLSPSPLASIDSAVWTGEAVLAASGIDLGVALYSPETDAWTEVGAVPVDAGLAGIQGGIALYWTGDEVVALTSPVGDLDAKFTFTALDLGTLAWGEPVVGPLSDLSGIPVWTGEEFVFLSYEDDPAIGIGDGRYDPTERAWTTSAADCPIDSSDGVWTGTLIISLDTAHAYEVGSGRCYTLPESPRPLQRASARAWTGNEVLAWSGHGGEFTRVRKDGLSYRPPA